MEKRTLKQNNSLHKFYKQEVDTRGTVRETVALVSIAVLFVLAIVG